VSKKTESGDSADKPPKAGKPLTAIQSQNMHSWAMSGILILAALAALYLARDLLLPIVMAIILNLVFAPFVHKLNKLRVPEPLGAAVVVIGLVALFAVGTYNLAGPAAGWVENAPKHIRAVGIKLSRISDPVKNINTAGEQMTATTQDIAAGTKTKQKAQEVTVKAPTLAGVVITAARNFTLGAVSMLVLLYFMLASGDLFLRKAIAMTPLLADKQRAVNLLRQIESEVSVYLFTVTVINVMLGCAVALAMYGLNVPNPALWGVMVGVLNFIPYLGDIASVTVLTVVGLLSFDEVWRGLLVPIVFFLLTAAEGYVIAPLIVGRRLRLNPIVIVLSVLFWGWMWGIFGAILAVPILVVLKSVCAHVESLRSFGEFLEA
jgi:predicted PurR-regulated permease PerM